MRTSGLCVALGLILAMSATASATISYDADVTPDVIFGSGNGNGFFTVDTQNNVEVGLRGKLRYQGVYNSSGDGSYSFDTGYYSTSTTVKPWNYLTSLWNFEWTVNTDLNGQTGQPVNALTYQLGLDFDPGLGTNYLTFDPINVPVADHSFGTNATANGAGVEAGDETTYATYLSTYNVVQQSWNMEWFDDDVDYFFDAADAGTYDVYLAAFDGQTEVARSAITVEVGGGAAVPEPMTMAGVFMGIAGLAGYIRKRRMA